MRFVFDTNAYSDWRSSGRWFEEVGIAEKVLIPTIVIGELTSGFCQGRFSKENAEKLNDFLGDPDVEILEISHETATIYGKLVAEVAKTGRKIPTNDVWIAATVIEHDATLLTRDKHFSAFANLKVKFGEW